MNIELNQESIEDRIVEDYVSRLDLDDIIKREVTFGIELKISEKFDEILTAKIDQLATDCLNMEYQQIDNFGRPAGEKTTIAKKLTEMMNNFWQQKVDRNGKPVENNYHVFGTRAEYLLTTAMRDDVEKTYKQNLVNVAAFAKDALRDQMRGSIDSVLNELFKVNSQGDMDKK